MIKNKLLYGALLCMMTLTACGGGGGGSDRTAAGLPTTEQSPTPEQIKAEQDESTQLLTDYVTQKTADEHALYEADEQQIRFNMAGSGLTCSSTHADQLIDAVEFYASRTASAASLEASSLATNREHNPSEFGQLFTALQTNEISYYQFPIACPSTFNADFNARAKQSIDAIYAPLLSDLRAEAVID